MHSEQLRIENLFAFFITSPILNFLVFLSKLLASVHIQDSKEDVVTSKLIDLSPDLP